mmetsp:Transcript_80355/g.126897  ORF Transcript_80355/g.126897 Transcript_80355/m.126897 type:complete len:200 (+) Transcript_80355:153-752(+)
MNVEVQIRTHVIWQVKLFVGQLKCLLALNTFVTFRCLGRLGCLGDRQASCQEETHLVFQLLQSFIRQEDLSLDPPPLIHHAGNVNSLCRSTKSHTTFHKLREIDVTISCFIQKFEERPAIPGTEVQRLEHRSHLVLFEEILQLAECNGSILFETIKDMEELLDALPGSLLIFMKSLHDVLLVLLRILNGPFAKHSSHDI